MLNCLGDQEYNKVLKHFLQRFPPGADRFEGIGWRPAANGCPVLEDSIAHMECKVGWWWWGMVGCARLCSARGAARHAASLPFCARFRTLAHAHQPAPHNPPCLPPPHPTHRWCPAWRRPTTGLCMLRWPRAR